MFMAHGVMFSIASLSIWYTEKLPAELKSLLWPTADENLDTGKTGWPNMGLDGDAWEKRPSTCQPVRYECRMKRLFYKVKDWYRGESIPKLPAKYGIRNKAHRRKEPNKSDFVISNSLAL